MSREIADHLRYYADLGVTGLSRDPAWRQRIEEVRLKADSTGHGADVASGLPVHRSLGEGGSRTAPAESLADIKTEIGPACMRCKLCSLGR